MPHPYTIQYNIPPIGNYEDIKYANCKQLLQPMVTMIIHVAMYLHLAQASGESHTYNIKVMYA